MRVHSVSTVILTHCWCSESPVTVCHRAQEHFRAQSLCSVCAPKYSLSPVLFLFCFILI